MDVFVLLILDTTLITKLVEGLEKERAVTTSCFQDLLKEMKVTRESDKVKCFRRESLCFSRI